MVEPNFERKQSLSDIGANIKKFDILLKNSEREWWDQFLGDPEKTCSQDIPQWYPDALKREEPDSVIDDDNGSVHLVSPLSLEMEKERAVKMVGMMIFIYF